MASTYFHSTSKKLDAVGIPMPSAPQPIQTTDRCEIQYIRFDNQKP